MLLVILLMSLLAYRTCLSLISIPRISISHTLSVLKWVNEFAPRKDTVTAVEDYDRLTAIASRVYLRKCPFRYGEFPRMRNLGQLVATLAGKKSPLMLQAGKPLLFDSFLSS